ncbi:MAG: MFS transporter [Chloroflexi bacterium]|nr:MFS transporter [Chloroflexota bacterium]
MQIRPRKTYYGWYVLGGVSSINFANAATAIGMLTVFILPLTDEFGWTRTEISAATSIGAVLGASASLLTGRLTDRYGARLPLAVGAVLIIVAMLNLAAMQSLLWFYIAFGVARLADQAFVQTPSSPAVVRWFLKYRGRALAILLLSASAGGVILPPLAQAITDAWNWRVAWLMLAGVMFLAGLLPTVLLVRRQPEDMGLELDGVGRIGPAGHDTGATGPSPQDTPEAQWSFLDALSTPTLWILLTSIVAAGVASAGVGLHLVPYLVEEGLQVRVAVGAVSIGFFASAVGNFVWGLLADRMPTRPLLVLALLLRLAGMGVLLIVSDIKTAYLFAAINGFTEGGLRTLTTLLMSEYYGRQNFGSIFGLTRALQVAGFAAGPLISGAVYDATASYDAAFVAFLALVALACALVAMAKRPVRRAGAYSSPR